MKQKTLIQNYGRINPLNLFDLILKCFQKIQLARVLPLVFVALVVPGGLPSIVLAMLANSYKLLIPIYRIVYPLVLTRHFWSPVVTRVYQTTEAGRNARYLYPRIIQHLEQSSGKV